MFFRVFNQENWIVELGLKNQVHHLRTDMNPPQTNVSLCDPFCLFVFIIWSMMVMNIKNIPSNNVNIALIDCFLGPATCGKFHKLIILGQDIYLFLFSYYIITICYLGSGFFFSHKKKLLHTSLKPCYLNRLNSK